MNQATADSILVAINVIQTVNILSFFGVWIMLMIIFMSIWIRIKK